MFYFSSQTINNNAQVGILGHRGKEMALACLHNCPLIANLEVWTSWSLVFEPEYGKLKDFIQKYGGLNQHQIEGKKHFPFPDRCVEFENPIFLSLVPYFFSKD